MAGGTIERGQKFLVASLGKAKMQVKRREVQGRNSRG
jgi:hypothetical protein